MEISVFIARVYGVCYLVLGAGLLCNQKFYRKVTEDFLKNAALIFGDGVFALVAGAVMLLVHNVWMANWTVFITLIGWIVFIKGVWFIVFPQTVITLMLTYRKNERLVFGHSVAALIIGGIVSFWGFFAG